jgi:hypothetical protein
MKTLTTVATVAALIAGVSVASAQMTRPADNNKATATQYNSQAADPSNSTRSSGAPSGIASSRQTTGTAAFCIS